MKVNSLWLKTNVASNWASKHLWGGTIYFAVDCINSSKIPFTPKDVDFFCKKL